MSSIPAQKVILLAEDREDDIVLVRLAFKKCGISNPLHIVRDGKEAIGYLQGSEKYANRAEYPLPALLLLDLKMPGLDGFDVLKWIARQNSLRAMCVLVLTGSDVISDVNLAYELGANSFLVKPHDFDQFVTTCQIIRDYWLKGSPAPQISRPSAAQAPKPAA
jgi:CheY-like chemotaxis protein